MVEDSGEDGILGSEQIHPALLVIIVVLNPGQLVLPEDQWCLAESVVLSVYGQSFDNTNVYPW